MKNIFIALAMLVLTSFSQISFADTSNQYTCQLDLTTIQGSQAFDDLPFIYFDNSQQGVVATVNAKGGQIQVTVLPVSANGSQTVGFTIYAKSQNASSSTIASLSTLQSFLVDEQNPLTPMVVVDRQPEIDNAALSKLIQSGQLKEGDILSFRARCYRTSHGGHIGGGNEGLHG